MTLEDEIFKRYKPDFSKLEKFGFKQDGKQYEISIDFYDNAFYAVIKLSKAGKVSGSVFDKESNEEYVPLRLPESEGGFVAAVRESYCDLLKEVRQECFYGEDFIGEQANRIRVHIQSKFGSEPEFLWKDTPDCAVFRNQESGKWFGIIINIPYTKIDNQKSGSVEVINIKLYENEIQDLIHNKSGYYPAWHMNKQKWISIALDETVNDEEIMEHIEESFGYTVKKKR